MNKAENNLAVERVNARRLYGVPLASDPVMGWQQARVNNLSRKKLADRQSAVKHGLQPLYVYYEQRTILPEMRRSSYLPPIRLARPG